MFSVGIYASIMIISEAYLMPWVGFQAPSFVFIDEIDALAGKNVNDDAERRATFQQLLAELDGE
jgi:ATP-dependent 26S proteasome regulatory subunit